MKKILLLISTFSTLACFGQNPYIRSYGTKEYLDFLGPKQVTELMPFRFLADSILPVTLPITFVLLSKDVSKEQLLKQVTILNQDFSNQTFIESNHKSPYYQKLAVDTQIRFCETFQVIEAYTDEKLDFALSKEYALKFGPESRNTILVFVGNLENYAGYAQMPGYAAETDAIFIDKKFLYGTNGTIYELGKTLTHLMGTYLGLGRLWGCIDEGVFDTPLMSVQHYDHVGSWSACYSYIYYTMPQNFMYNTYDKYLNMFTVGQKEFIHTVLSNERSNLLLSTCKTTEP
jgi:hypothetical protein